MLAVRLAPIRQQDNLVPEKAAKMENTTTTRESYKGLRSTPAAAIRPRNRSLGNVEPFKGNTENRDAFTPKQIQHVQAYRLRDNNIMSGTYDGSSSSGYNDDFKDRGVVKTQSFAPSYAYMKPSTKFSNETTNKTDFRPYNEVRRLPYSNQKTTDHWNETQTVPGMGQSQSTYKLDFPVDRQMVGERVSFQPPISTLKLGRESVEMSTNYTDDFTYKGLSKPKSYAPLPTFMKPGVKMESSTEAHDKFTGKYLPPPKSFRPRYDLDQSRPPLEGITNYNDSYQKFRFISEAEFNNRKK